MKRYGQGRIDKSAGAVLKHPPAMAHGGRNSMNVTQATPASNPSIPRVLAYVRCSTTEQADSGAGVAAQRAALRAEAGRRGWAVEIIEDAGYSARSMKRPGITDALGRLRRGEADTLMVAKMDRLSRSLLDFAGIV